MAAGQQVELDVGCTAAQLARVVYRNLLREELVLCASEMQLRQNKMMFARVKYQALAIVVVALVIMASR